MHKVGDSGDKGLSLTRDSYKNKQKTSHIHKSRMNLEGKSRKEIGVMGEAAAAEYARRRGMRILDRNVSRKTGEIDVIALDPNNPEGETLHFIEVKTIVSDEFPEDRYALDAYDPSLNLHELKIRKVARTAEWYVLQKEWEGEWQVDGCLVWLRRRDGIARVRYLPQIV